MAEPAEQEFLRSIFLMEAWDTVAALDCAAATLARPEGVDEADGARLFRAVHTLKGAAYVVGCVRVGEVAHRMEDVLVVAREGRRPLTPRAVETLFAAEGALRLMLGLPPDPRANVTDVVAGVRARLDALLDGVPVPAPAPPAAPFPEPVPALSSSLAALLSTPRPAPARAAPRRPPRQTIRVNLERLDPPMDPTGAMVIARARRSEIGRARLVPIGSLFGRFVRQGQAAARAAGKSVRFETRGEAVELDTAIIEQIVDPLLHLVQNTITHGIEAPDERRACGKDAAGTVTLSAAHEGGAVLVEVADDGRGIDPDLVRRSE